MKKFILKSLLSMILAWILVVVGLVLIDGTGGGIEQVLGLFLMGVIFITIAWVVFLFPFIKFIRKVIQNQILRIIFPLITAFYGLFAFVIIFGGLQGFNAISNLLSAPSTISISATCVGFLWGVFVILLTQNDVNLVEQKA